MLCKLSSSQDLVVGLVLVRNLYVYVESGCMLYCYNVTCTFRTKQYCSETTNPDVGTNVTVKVMSCV